MGFNFNFLNTNFNTLYADSNTTLGADLLTDTLIGSTMFTWFADVFDAANQGNGKTSSIGYQTDTVASKKICKIEWNNVAFLDDLTSLDSANAQLWMYEDSNAVEFRFGLSSVNSIADIYPGLNGPTIGFITNLDMLNFTFDWFYYVSNLNLAKVDSADVTALSNGTNIGLTTFPINGTVFRFSKRTKQQTSIGDLVNINSDVSLYPNPSSNTLYANCKNNNSTILIFDAAGKLCLTQKLSNGINQLDITSLAKGNYITTIKNLTETSFYKIIKQ
jgi:hypothetical protein